MKEILNVLISQSKDLNHTYTPKFYRLNTSADKLEFEILLKENKNLSIRNEIYGQLQELIKIENPAVKIATDEYEELIINHLNGIDLYDYGVWIFYPWNNTLIHALDKDEFVKVRTNRNQYKITEKEQNLLNTKRIGIVGLSVGQSIALTLAMERTCGELRLADFDTAELSNLNRLRTGIHNLGLKKTIIAAREIAEIDPYLNVKIFDEGLHKDNLDTFFLENGKLDLFIEVCDGLDIKIESRFKARELRIPVIMDTNDRGMLDVERFDLEPQRSILHGLADGLDPENVKGLTNEDKIPYILKIVGADSISTRLKASMVEVEQSINTWPQLASSVTLGGAATTDVSRRILLEKFHDSGRYYIDLEEIVADKETTPRLPIIRNNHFAPLTKETMLHLINGANTNSSEINLEAETITELVTAACFAPSTGNDQPWKWLYKNGILYLFHDEYRSFSFGDFQKIASFISFGAAYENLYISALKSGIETSYTLFPNPLDEKLVASIYFKKSYNSTHNLLDNLANAIPKRHTNRNLDERVNLSESIYYQLSLIATSITNAKIQWFKDENELLQLAEIIGACDRIRLLNLEGHYDFVHHEMRWTSEDAAKRKDGIDVKTLGLSNSQLAALNIIKSEDTINEINNVEGGKALEMIAKKSVKAASALCLITLPKYSLQSFFEGGRSMERLWLAATNLDLAVHPLISPLYFFPRILHGNGESLKTKDIEELKILREKFKKIAHVYDDSAEVFLAKIAIAEEPKIKSFRLPIKDRLIID